jgi:hypothetical protein
MMQDHTRILFGTITTLLLMGCSDPIDRGQATTSRERFSTGNVELVTVHIVGDLLFRGCDVTQDPFGLACRWASFLACQARGFVGGLGPVEIGAVEAQVVCVGSAVAAYREVSYSGMCDHGRHSTIYCDSLAHRSCKTAGYATSSGVVGANANVVGVLCLSASVAADVPTNLGQLRASATYPSCDAQSVWGPRNGCQHHAHRLCRARGHAASVGVVEYDAGTQNAAVSCVQGATNSGGFGHGPLGLERPLALGANVLGSRVPGPHATNTPDVLVNTNPFPVLIRRVDYGSNYDGRHGYSRDTCFYLNRMMIYQADDNDDGELFCTYSDAAQDPAQVFGDLGVLVKPGERIAFHATPRWGHDAAGVPFAQNFYSWAVVQVSQASGAIPVRRVRFPRWDTGYSVGPSELTIVAGNESNSPPPASVPPGKPSRSSNAWHLVQQATWIRGVSVFISQGQASGTQGLRACLRVVQQGGANIQPPHCIEVSGDTFGPHSFPGGSAMIRLDRLVPAGALVGVDFTLRSATPTHMDFVGYVWLQQAP